MTIYVRLRELRLALGLTQAELAARAGTRRATVSRLENSRVTAIELEVLEKLADVLEVEPGFLLSRTPAPAGGPARGRSRARRYENETAFGLVQAMIGEGPRPEPPGKREKNPEAVARGRTGGKGAERPARLT